MSHHDAYGLSLADLDIAIVENSRAMQTTVRSMLATFGVRRIRTYDTVPEALTAMLPDPPSVVIAAWNLTPMNGERLISTMRDTAFPSLCNVPVIVATAHATLSVIDTAFSAGCNALLVKPMSPKVLLSRLEWLIRDASEMKVEDGRVVVSGVREMLDSRVRNSPLASSILRATALEAMMRDEPASPASVAEQGRDAAKAEALAAAEKEPEAKRAPEPEAEPASPAPDSREARRAAIARKRARRWHGWTIGSSKGSTAA